MFHCKEVCCTWLYQESFKTGHLLYTNPLYRIQRGYIKKVNRDRELAGAGEDVELVSVGFKNGDNFFRKKRESLDLGLVLVPAGITWPLHETINV